MIEFSRAAARALRRMPTQVALRIRAAIDRLEAEPGNPGLDVRPIEGQDGMFRMRVGEWRALYRRDGLVLRIENIAPRGGAYR